MNGFGIDFVSDVNREHLMAEISFNGQRLCVLDRERGVDEIEIEFLVDLYVLSDSVRMKFSLDKFIEIIEIARADLRGCA
ncbi:MULTISPECIES: hypothetical protein [Burkholderia cepacia complex]|uniref:hypothetical protein n=1 Tax=Burkholderia cepacia complex TaxID=87882 RepID=UPI002011F3C1|nr:MULTISPECIES: hypothetical protein [Burkholderia cepacia complex]MDN7560187.1 hypothetical protein [Burkholderia orbicola]